MDVYRIRLFDQLRPSTGIAIHQKEQTSGGNGIAYVLGPDFMRSTICDLIPFSFS